MNAPTQDLDRTLAPSVNEAVAAVWYGWDHEDTGTPEAADAALRQVSSIVNALSGGTAYSVGLADGGTAYTDFDHRVVKVTGAALRDVRLALAERLGVTTALAVHEAGHARLSHAISKAAQRKYQYTPQAGLAAQLCNISEDVRLEQRTVETFPAFAGLFDLALWWVAQRYPSGGVTRMPISQPEAVNLCVAAVRYDAHTAWSADADVQAERAWWQDWARRATTGKASDKSPHALAAVAEALDHIAHLPLTAPIPAQPPVPQPSEGDEADEDMADALPGEGDEGEGIPTPSAEPVEQDPTQRGETFDLDGEGDDEGDEADEADDSTGEGKAEAEAAPEADEADEDADTGRSADLDGDAVETDEPQPSEGDEAGETGTMGGSGNPDDMSGEDRPSVGSDARGENDRDALAEPLPAHVADALTRDEVVMDRAMASAIAATRAQRGVKTSRTSETVRVSHHDGIITTATISEDRAAQGGGNGAGMSLLAPMAMLDPDADNLAVGGPVSVAVDQGAAAMIRAAFSQTRVHRDSRRIASQGSRLLGRKVAATAWGDEQVFVRRDAPAPDRLNIHLLIDASGSMHGQNLTKAIKIGATLVEGLRRIPGTRVNVWSHNTGSADSANIEHVLDSRRGDSAQTLANIYPGGANRDGTAIAALTQARIIPGTEQRERAILIVLSDGAPCESHEYVSGAVNTARKAGVGVISVAISHGLTETQQACYGATNVVAWTGDWRLATRQMAQIVGRLA